MKVSQLVSVILFIVLTRASYGQSSNLNTSWVSGSIQRTHAPFECTLCDINYTIPNIAVYNTQQENIYAIITYVDSNIEYKFYWYPQNIYSIWNEMIGDCTDRVTLKQIMLSNIYVPSIEKHGYCSGIKHDYLAYKLNGRYIIDGNLCQLENLTDNGNGIW